VSPPIASLPLIHLVGFFSFTLSVDLFVSVVHFVVFRGVSQAGLYRSEHLHRKWHLLLCRAALPLPLPPTTSSSVSLFSPFSSCSSPSFTSFTCLIECYFRSCSVISCTCVGCSFHFSSNKHTGSTFKSTEAPKTLNQLGCTFVFICLCDASGSTALKNTCKAFQI